jgi:hypothetical protein
MTVDKQVEAMEKDLKLLKAEVQESLETVRDFLFTLKTPLPLKDLDAGSDSRLEISGGLGMGPNRGMPPEVPRAEPKPPAPPPQAQPPRAETPRAETPGQEPEDATVERPRVLALMPRPEPKPPEAQKTPPDKKEDGKENKMTDKTTTADKDVASSQVNLLANLMRWAVVAKEKVGSERLGTFLDIYGTAADLTPEMKEVIVKLSQVSDAPSEGNIADVWSRLLLELHGILTGNSPLRQVEAEVEGPDPTAQAEKASDPPAKPDAAPEPANADPKWVRLKLVLPDNGGREREFDVR